jgi:hypothetical protein
MLFPFHGRRLRGALTLPGKGRIHPLFWMHKPSVSPAHAYVPDSHWIAALQQRITDSTITPMRALGR